MSTIRRVLCCALLGLGVAARGAQPPLALELRSRSAQATVEFDERSGVATDPAGVIVRYGDAELTARTVRVDRQTGETEAEGGVRLQRGQELWTGDRLRYNFLTRQMSADRFRTGVAPYFAAGEGLSANFTNQTHTATNAFVTTDDIAEPTYLVRAKSIAFVPGRYLEARHATLYLGSVPVLYLPVYRRSFERHPNNFSFLPGYRSLYGPYLLGSYNWMVNTNLGGTVHFDYRLKRGFGGGPDVDYDLGLLGQGEIRTYVTRDEEPRADPNGRPIAADRHRLGFFHSATLRSNLTARVVASEQSDAYILRDFFESEYRRDIQPKSFLEVNQLWPNFSLSLLARPQLNDFFQTVERLPDLKLSAFRQQLGISPFYYEGENSAGYFRFRTGESVGTNYAALRADTFHQLLLPQTVFGWLNVTPRAGVRFTHYGEQEGAGSALLEQNRGVFNTGVEVSTKASRIWPGARSRFWDVTALRHIVEPSVNYVFVPSPSAAPRELPQFDYELRSLRLVPVDFLDYNAIDSIDSQNVLRFGLRNKLQTKRLEQSETLVHWALATDWRLDPRADQDTFADLYSDLDLKPRSWLTLNSELRWDLDEGLFRMANHTATIEPTTTWHWKVGHRYLRDDPAFGPLSGNNIFLSSLYYRFNENWGARLTHHFEARDGRLEEQFYTLYRDLRSWTAALTLRLRDNRQGLEDITVAVSISLKAFPRYKVGQDRNEPSLLLGG